MKQQKKKGFSLIECLISLTIFLLIILACMEFLISARRHYSNLKEEQELQNAALSALDKIRSDIIDAGRGLNHPARLGIIQGLYEESGALVFLSADCALEVNGDLFEGQNRIWIDKRSEAIPGKMICLFDSIKGETKSIISSDSQSIFISTPLEHSYKNEQLHLVLIRKISLFLHQDNEILRRKVNTSPSQPLAENVSDFDFFYDESSNLFKIGLTSKGRKEKVYELCIFPKNMAFCQRF